MQGMFENVPWWAWAVIAAGLILFCWGILRDGTGRRFLGAVLMIIGGLVAEALHDEGGMPHKDEELRMAFVEAESDRFDALGIQQLYISCDPATKTLTGKFWVKNSPFDKGAVAKSKTACSGKGPVLSVENPHQKFFLGVWDTYKPELILGEIDGMMKTQFGGLQFNRSLALALDRKNLGRADREGVTAVRFLCVDGVFRSDANDGLWKGATGVACQAPADGPAPQLRIFSQMSKKGLIFDDTNRFPDYYVLATPDMTGELANTLLGVVLAKDGRKTAF